MIIKLELFGMSRELSKDEFLHFEFDNEITIKDLRIKLEQMIKNEFPKNANYLEVVKKSAFSSEDNEIVEDSYKLNKDQKLAIIPPIGGG